MLARCISGQPAMGSHHGSRVASEQVLDFQNTLMAKDSPNSRVSGLKTWGGLTVSGEPEQFGDHTHCAHLNPALNVLPQNIITRSRDSGEHPSREDCWRLWSRWGQSLNPYGSPNTGQAATVCAHPGDRFLSSGVFKKRRKPDQEDSHSLIRGGLA